MRLCPTREQEILLFQMAGARRWVWNWALRRRIDTYKANGESVSWSDLSKELTALKREPETAWLSEIDSQALQQALSDLKCAFTRFFEKKARFPRWKSRKNSVPSFRIPQRVFLDGNLLSVPKIGSIRVRNSYGEIGATKSATFKCDAKGHWTVSLVGTKEVAEGPYPLPMPEAVVGLDAGLATYATLSNGEEIENPKFVRNADRKTRRLSRAVSRKKKGSKNRKKAGRKLARRYAKVASQRKDFLSKLTTELVREYRAIGIEDLSVKGLARTKLARSILDASFGEFARMLTYKGVWYGTAIVKVDRFFPSTKRCSLCHHQQEGLTLSDRSWTCDGCGTHHRRDPNAAQNLKQEALRLLYMAAGHADMRNAHGETVRPMIRRLVSVK